MPKKKEWKAIRKSAFMMFKQCPAKFKFYYDDPNYWNYGVDEKQQNNALRRGNEFHNSAEEFFNDLQKNNYWKEDICDNTDLSVEEYFQKIIKKVEDPIVNEWIDWFVKIEAERFNILLDKNQLEYFIPIANELKIDMPNTIGRTGHVDRIDGVPGSKSNDLCIVEYKTGKSYDMNKVDRATSMNAEMGWYIQILIATKHFPNQQITHWKVINPTLQKQWVNKISPISLRTVEKVYEDMVKRLKNRLKFPKNPSTLCYDCPYLQQCDPFYEESVELNFGTS